MSNTRNMLNTAVTNRAMDLYRTGVYNSSEIACVIQDEINECLDTSVCIAKSGENLLSILNKVITNIQANSNNDEWGKVCIATLEYVKRQINIELESESNGNKQEPI